MEEGSLNITLSPTCSTEKSQIFSRKDKLLRVWTHASFALHQRKIILEYHDVTNNQHRKVPDFHSCGFVSLETRMSASHPRIKTPQTRPCRRPEHTKEKPLSGEAKSSEYSFTTHSMSALPTARTTKSCDFKHRTPLQNLASEESRTLGILFHLQVNQICPASTERSINMTSSSIQTNSKVPLTDSPLPATPFSTPELSVIFAPPKRQTREF